MYKKTVTFFNLWVLLAGFLGFNNEHASLDQLVQQKSLAQTKYIEYNHPAPLDETHYASKLDALGLSLSEAGTTQDSKPDLSSLNHCKSLVYRTLASLPKAAVQQLKDLTLNFSTDARRGLGGGSTIILRCSNVTDEELVGVLVHEMGHITDTGTIQGTDSAGTSEFKDGSNPIYNDDPSLDFYRLSFTDSNMLRPDATPLDFVSGYAMTDPFEDFAETYNYYILHGNEFRQMIEKNDVLKKKYNFLKIRIFNGKEFFNGDDAQKINVADRNYDTTVLHYDMKKFFLI